MVTNQGRATSPQNLYTMNTIDQIRAEIERRIKHENELIWNAKKRGTYYSPSVEPILLTLNSLLSFLDTLKEQPVCEGLEEAAEGIVCSMINESSAIGVPNDHIPSWVQDAMIQSFKAGAKWQKEQMMMRAYTSSVAELNGMLYFSMPISMYHRHKEIIDSGIVKLIIKEV